MHGFSRVICVVCNFQLKDFCVFKKKLQEVQKGLLKFTASRISQKKVIKHELEEDDDLSIKTEIEDLYEDSRSFMEPEVKFNDSEEKENVIMD